MSDGAPSQLLKTPWAPIVEGTQVISVGGVEWTQIEDLALADGDDQVYTFDPVTGDVQFGDGLEGWDPADEIEAYDYSMYSADKLFLSEERVGSFAVLGIRAWQNLIREHAGEENTPDMVITEWGILQASYPGAAHFLRSLTQGIYTASGLISFIEMGIPLANRHSLVDFDPSDPDAPGFGAPDPRKCRHSVGHPATCHPPARTCSSSSRNGPRMSR